MCVAGVELVVRQLRVGVGRRRREAGRRVPEASSAIVDQYRLSRFHAFAGRIGVSAGTQLLLYL